MSIPTLTRIPKIHLRTIQADGVEIFYRESGPPDAPTILLLHGYPTSSFMFRDLIPRLASRYHLIAPDLPGFGFTNVPAARNYIYTFDNLAKTVEAFTEALSLEHYALYVFDYGAPTGLRLALAQPDRVTALISQNGNAYLEGLGAAWDPIKAYWQDPTPANREVLRGFLGYDGTRYQYAEGVPNPQDLAPETWWLDLSLLGRPGMSEIRLDLFLDYRNNLDLYPAFQHWFREAQPPTLVIWGRHDPFFIPPGAEAYKRDLPMATVRLLDTGHFALETHVDEIAEAIDELLTQNG